MRLVVEKIASRWPRVSVPVFNRFCLAASLVWLLLTVPLGMYLRPTWPDFSQFYMGGLIARENEWRSLYPLPIPNGTDNPGLAWHSFAKGEWNDIRVLRGVPNDTRFMLPPPSALLFVPLTYLDLTRAFWSWIAFLTICLWGVAVVSGRIYREMVGHPTRIEGLLAIFIAVSPLAARAIRIGNTSPPIAFLLGCAVLALLRRDRPSAALTGASAIALGALLKYATVILTPLLVAMRQWRTLAWLCAIGAWVVLTTYFLTGPEPYVEYVTSIMPSLDRPSAYPGNQSLPGLIARTVGRPFPFDVALSLTIARLSTLTGILYLIFRTPQREWLQPARVTASAALLVSWLLVFSPIAWEHWPVFLCPLWGWMVWEARWSRVRRALAITSLALMYLPAGITQVQGFFTYEIYFPEPLNSWQLLGVMLILPLGTLTMWPRHSAVRRRHSRVQLDKDSLPLQHSDSDRCRQSCSP